MRLILSERNLVGVLFVLVLITFALAHEDSKKMERVYTGVTSSTPSKYVWVAPLPDNKVQSTVIPEKLPSVSSE